MKRILIVIVLLMFHVELFAANKASQVDFLISGLVDSSGRALASGKVYFYTAGSYSSLKTIWTDKDKNTTAANPVTLDAYGKKPIFADGFYNIEVQNSSSATLYKIANVYFGHFDASVYDSQDYTDFPTTINAISSSNSTIEIRSSIDIGTNTTIPANVKLIFFKGGQFNKTASCTVTINGSIEAEPDKIFNGFSKGDIVYNNGYIREVYPQWWGFSESGTAGNNRDALECAIRATAGRIFIPKGSYNCAALTIDRSNLSIEAAYPRASIFNFASGVTSPITIDDAANVVIRNLEAQYADTSAIGITISGSSSSYRLDNLYLQHPSGVGAGAYGVFINASDEPIKGEIKQCTIYKPYYGIYSQGAYANKNVSITDNTIDTVTYGIYDAGSSTGWIINGNKFLSFTKLGIHTKSQGITINDNLFDIGTNQWDTFDGSISTRNPIMMGTNSTKLSAYGNVFVSGGTETTDRSKLFYAVNSTLGAYFFSDPWDAVRTDSDQRHYGGQIFHNINSTDEIVRIQKTGTLTADMVQCLDNSDNVISGVNSNGNPFERIVQVASDSGTIALDCAQGTNFYCPLTENIGTVTISNAKDGITMSFLVKQGTSSYNIEKADFPSNVKFDNDSYSLGATASRLDCITFRYYGTSTGLFTWYEISRTDNMREP